jgi:ABC-type antimicrobial peptide transport system permease subunit
MLHKLRSGLTMLGIVFGVFSVIAMLAIGEGASQQAQQQVLKLGATNIIVRSVKPPRENASQSNSNAFVLRYGLKRTDFDLLSKTILLSFFATFYQHHLFCLLLEQIHLNPQPIKLLKLIFSFLYLFYS